MMRKQSATALPSTAKLYQLVQTLFTLFRACGWTRFVQICFQSALKAPSARCVELLECVFAPSASCDVLLQCTCATTMMRKQGATALPTTAQLYQLVPTLFTLFCLFRCTHFVQIGFQSAPKAPSARCVAVLQCIFAPSVSCDPLL